MKRDYIYLFIILVFLGIIFYLHTTTVPTKLFKDLVPTSENQFGTEPIDNTVTKKDIEDYLNKLNDIIATVEMDATELSKSIMDAPDTDFISTVEAKGHVERSLEVREINNDSTRAIYFTLPMILKKVLENENKDRFELSDLDLMKTGMYVYFGIYPSTDTLHADQTMAILQLVDENKNALVGQTFNFGDLCPRNCPINELLFDK